jgi:pyruvate dehydrogenase E1 component alpha subunit
MKVMAVREATQKALEEIRAGAGPQFLEAVTYRYKGHSMGDPERYRKPEEIRHWEESDPIGLFGKELASKKLATRAELEDAERRAEAEVQEAVTFAERSPDPAPEELFDNVYAEG